MRHEREEQDLAQVLRTAYPLPDPSAPAKAVAAMAQARRVAHRRPRWLLAAAAGALVLAALLMRPLFAPGQPLLAVVAVRGPAQNARGQKLEVGDRMPAGAAVLTGAKGRVTLVSRRDSEFTLAADTRLELGRDGKTASLARGRLYCRNRAHEFAVISTVAGRIALLGTTVDADTKDEKTVAVTVVQGEVRLENAHGEAVVPSGRKAVLTASAAPEAGRPVNTAAETAWYGGRGEVLSAAGDIAYAVPRGDGLATEVWVMRADGRGRQRVKTYTGGWWADTGAWLPGVRSLFISTGSLMWKNPGLRHEPRLLGLSILDTPGSSYGERQWILDAATGQDAPFALPHGPWVLSPDGRRLAFHGWGGQGPFAKAKGGIWVYDMASGAMKKLLDGYIETPFSWSPDSRYLAASTGEGYEAMDYPLVIIDVATGEVRDLHVQGVGTSFSPDGTKLAFCGDFQKSGAWYRGVPMSGSVFVLDLRAGGEPRRVSPRGEGTLNPRWSPDGRRLLCLVIDQSEDRNDNRHRYRLSVANADGSGSHEIYHGEGLPRAAEWAPSGETVYVVSLQPDIGGHGFTTRIFTVAADGSGTVKDLGGNTQDSILPPAEKAQTDAAFADLREAVYQYEVGQLCSYEGKAKEAKAAFRASADLFASLVWKHPLSGFGTTDLAAYADTVEPLANQSESELLRKSCEQHLTHYLSWGLLLYMGRERLAPTSLADLERWLLTHDWGMRIEWVANTDTEWVKMFLRCPKGDSFVFHPTPNRAYPKVGDVIATCSNHRESRLVWTEGLAGMLRERLGIERLSAAHEAEKAKTR